MSKTNKTNNSKNNTVRNFQCVQYVKHSGMKRIEELIKIIKDNYDPVDEKKWFKNYCYIKHDKDVDENGALKDEHYHFFLQCNQGTTYASWAERLGYDEPSQICRNDADYFSACQYATHMNNPLKYQYSFGEVVASFNYKEKVIDKKKTKDFKAQNETRRTVLINAILNGEVRRHNVVEYLENNGYPLELYVKWKKQIDDAFKIRDEIDSKIADREMDVVFISGRPGTGKTFIGKQIAKKLGYSYFISGSSNDILDGYKQEDCIILDDLREESFTNLADALKLLDPHTSSKFKSRYYNKVICAKLIIITSTQDLINTIGHEWNEDARQVKRRVKTRLYVNSDEVKICYYNEKLDWEVEVGSFKNPVSDFKEKKEKEEKKNFFTPEWFKENIANITGFDA